MLGVTFDGVSKVFPGAPPALDHLNLSIHGGELFGIVGPSGCGKSTALRILAGLDSPSAGRILAAGEDITDVEPRRRRFGLITQQNQLMGHRTAGRNIQFPLEMRDPEAKEGPYEQRLRDEAAGLRIEHLLDRKPKTLSEGERRLIQLARVVIGRPTMLLMDEPLSFLEDQVRLRLRGEIVRLHRERSLTSVVVTASQHDAMAMSDRIAVLFDGVLEQIGTPDDVYYRPATGRVAAFFGEPAMNIVPARVEVAGAERRLEVLGLRVRIPTAALDAHHGSTVHVGFRPDELVAGGPAVDSLEVRVVATEPLGRQTMIEAVTTAQGIPLNCTLPGQPPPVGTTLDIGLRPDRFHYFDAVTEQALHHPPSPRP